MMSLASLAFVALGFKTFARQNPAPTGGDPALKEVRELQARI